jgi:spore maturation protein CgeB
VRVLVIGAGAGWSTKDVENGVMEGLRAAGVEAGRYALDQRLACSSDYLMWVWRRAKRQDLKATKPAVQDMQLHALQDLLPRALAHQVDWVVIVSAMFVPAAFIDVMRMAGLPVAILFTESPYDQAKELEWARLADLAWTNERSSVDAFANVTPAARYLAHALRPGVHRAGVELEDVPSHDVVFVGSCFDEREELLSAIDWDGIDLGLYGNWQRLSRRSPLKKFVREGVIDNARTAALYRHAKIGLNLYRESMGWAKNAPRIAHAESLNPRAYELAACGCFHISQQRDEVTEKFGDLVPTFTSAAECEALIRRWVSDDVGRARITSCLPAAVSLDTWLVRGRQMVEDLKAAHPAALSRIASMVATRQQRVAEAAA